MSLCTYAQSAIVKGFVLNKNNQAVSNVNITCMGVKTNSKADGFYSIKIPANQKVLLAFTHVSFKKTVVSVQLSTNEVYEFNVVISDQQEQMGEIIVTNTNRRQVQGVVSIEPGLIKKMAGANAGIENILKTLPGVNSNNELSTQYAVRGGNYDENLVYVNEIEVYRPFLIRSGQQEGLSFTNTDLVQNVDFSAGGFQAKFGDKLSSVLDITYRKPTKLAGTFEASFLGGSASLDVISKNKKWTAVSGVRYRNNSLLVNSQDTQTNYKPTFVDVQTNVNFNASDKWNFNFLGNISQNNYNYQPLSRQTRFGTIDQPMVLTVFYEGQEKDRYATYFGAFKTTYKASENFTIKFISSLFHTTEEEHFDILAQYRLGEVDATVGGETYDNVSFTRGIGAQLHHARNNLDALISNTEIKGFHDWRKNLVEWGAKYTRESIRDRVVEWEVIDSAGFALNPPDRFLPVNDQPYSSYTGPLVPYNSIRATNFNTINRFSGYVQWSRKDKLGSSDVWYNAGMRMQNWAVSGTNANGTSQTVFSPRGQFAIKPNWEKDMVFRASGGVYYQPPFYRELRDASGQVQANVKAQKSIHMVLGNDYSFKMWDRPFKLVSELYYKSLTNVNTYTVDNVRIRYDASNDAVAYAQGLDLRINGEFVPGTESWVSFGYLKTEENSAGKGYIARPTDQRLKFALLFQDYMPNIPSVKLYLNLVYNTGLPGGSPAYADPYIYQNRLNDYRRADVGFFKSFIDDSKPRPKSGMFKDFKELAVGFEIFNLFNNQNAITNTWVRDVYTKSEYGIPNFMTTRVFNIKLTAKL
ncbi:TonB-dependent receptor [Flavobacterium faecale]|uniref:TonB-dependent receptor n=1 Tax=Flavobacterium faecale TaxID=1355330 RepID=A0A2S1LD57_9FLAO|nr:TonB-dependent receptor plug domain-containing protein [Flavobacterium faecale]AWG21637.1 TonB-dependent receptor [Flavobacterium faecale]